MNAPQTVHASPSGRTRLIEAAIYLFGRDGYDATSVRAVADEASVSWGLVRFYFGSKEGLRQAAEDHVSEAYLDFVSAAAEASSTNELYELIDLSTKNFADVARFLRRALVEERPVAFQFLSRLIEADTDMAVKLHQEFPTEEWLTDPIRNVATRLGYLLLAPQFSVLLGRDVFSTEEIKLRNQRNLRILHLVRLGLEAENADNRFRMGELGAS
jgi:AcrR family transcriptional regulator